MKKVFDFLVWHFGLPMVVGWSLLLLFGFADSDTTIAQCQANCIGDCEEYKENISTQLYNLSVVLNDAENDTYTLWESYLMPLMNRWGDDFTNQVYYSIAIFADNIANSTDCYIGMENNILRYPSHCSLVCSSNTASSCSVVCSTNEYNTTWYCSVLTNYFYDGQGFLEVSESLDNFSSQKYHIITSSFYLARQIDGKIQNAQYKVDVLSSTVDSLPCDDYCTLCSSNCVQKLGTNCVIECRVVDEDGIYREECSTNCWEGPTSPQCCDFTWLEDMLRDLMDDVNSILEDLDTLVDWLDNWKTFLGWVDYYSRRPPGMDWVRRYTFSPIYSYSQDGDMVITNQLRAFDYKEVNERFGELSGNYFQDSIRMAYEIFTEVNQGNAILASLNTNLSMRLEDKDSLEQTTNQIVSAWDSAPTNSNFGFSRIDTNKFVLADDFAFPELPRNKGKYLPSTIQLDVPWEFHNNDIDGGDIVRRPVEFDLSEHRDFFDTIRNFCIFLYWALVLIFWLLVAAFVAKFFFRLIKVIISMTELE